MMNSLGITNRWRTSTLWSPGLTALLVASVLLLGAISALAVRSLATLKTGNEFIIHAQRVRFENAQILQLLTDVETGLRGYALSGNPIFLDPYQAALAPLSQSFANLKHLIAEDPTQQANEVELETRAQACLSYALGVIQQVESGDVVGARNVTASGEGKRRMDAARKTSAQLEAEELRLLDLRRVGRDQALQQAGLALWVSGTLAVILLFVIAYSAVRTGERLRRGERTLATTLRSVGDAVISTDSAGVVHFMNAVAERLTGWDQHSARGRGLDQVFRIVNEQTRAPVEGPASKVLREGTIIGLANHTLLIARDGTELPIEDSAAPIIDGESLVGVVLVFRDATADRAAQRALLRSEQRFRAAVDAMQGVLWTTSAEGEMLGEQPGWAALTGQQFADYQGFGWAGAIHPEDAQRTIDAWKAAVATQRPFVVEHRVRRHDGEWRTFAVRAVPIFAEAAVREWVGVHTDISDRLHAEELLRDANRRKDVFLATLSHELRNPLAPIRNAARLLESDAIKPQDIERSRLIIARQVRHMASLLDDLLDMSRITRGGFTLKKVYVNLQLLLAEAVETAKPFFDAKRHTLELDWPTPPIEVDADRVRLVQVISNLLTNAAKYTDPEGHITFAARSEENNIIINVRDTGVGLAPEMLTHVFEMFTQVQPQQERSDGGLGIGLALAKGLVELHGGHIVARSEGLGRGSEFIVVLPNLCVAGGALQQTSTADNDRAAVRSVRRVLIADDNRDGAESLAMILERSGHQVYTAHTGPEALQMAAQHRPHVAILDIGMPGFSGYEVAERIRREAWGLHITLIAATGWGQEEDRRRALRAGFDHHLTKPVDPKALERLFALP
jgi:PAS domain S-box-containing protein